jgi:protein-S-isoprenylcysteine O-methyltransferase Ste14
MKRVVLLLYGLLAYLVGASAYFAGLGGFLANGLGPFSIDRGPETPFLTALAINTVLLLLFAVPHSLMARDGFKRWWTRVIPPAAERSTFMLQAGLLAGLLIWQWRPMTGVLWQVEHPLGRALIWSVYGLGWLIAFIATFLINHFELTGLQQVYAHFSGREPRPVPFHTPFLYRVVRHPMQLGVLLAFWAAPEMTAGRLVFALGMTAYILVGLHFEERDLVRRFGAAYLAYQQRTPRLIPMPRLRRLAPDKAVGF